MVDYKQKYIELSKALTNLKRGKVSDWDMEVMGCGVDQFHDMNQYLVADNFNVKERAEFIARLEKLGVDLFNTDLLKTRLDLVRHRLHKYPDDVNLITEERILGNMLFNKDVEGYLEYGKN